MTPLMRSWSAHPRPDSIWGTGRVPMRIFVGPGGRTDSIRVAGNTSYVTRFYYDGRGRDTSMVDPSRHIYKTHYESAFGNADSSQAPGNRVQVVRFDRFGRDSATRANSEPWRRIVYDDVNRVTSTNDGVNTAPVEYGYDALFSTRVKDQIAQVYKHAVNAIGWPTQRFDPADTLNRFTSYRYDRTGRHRLDPRPIHG